MERILVPTDFSDCALTAFRAALDIAVKFEAEIHLLHIINSPYDWVKVPKNFEKNHPDVVKKIGEARAKLGSWVRDARAQNVRAIEFITYNKSYEGIIEHVNQYDNDLLVMGTFGSRGIKRIIGSNTLHVIRNTPIPALLVKPGHQLADLKRIIFASDFEQPDADEVELLKAFSSKFNLPVTFLSVNTPNHFEDTRINLKKMKRISEQFAIQGADLEVYNAFNIPTGIIRFNNTRKNLIFLEYHQRSLVEKVFNRSITEYLLEKSASMILAYPSLY